MMCNKSNPVESHNVVPPVRSLRFVVVGKRKETIFYIIFVFEFKNKIHHI